MNGDVVHVILLLDYSDDGTLLLVTNIIKIEVSLSWIKIACDS